MFLSRQLAVCAPAPPHDQPDHEADVESHGEADEEDGPAGDEPRLPDDDTVPPPLLQAPLLPPHLGLLGLLGLLGPATDRDPPPVERRDWPVVVAHVVALGGAQRSEDVELVLGDWSCPLEDAPCHNLITSRSRE